MRATIDLNCDLGEQEGSEGELLDLRLLPLVTCVNAACGGHAGNLQRLQVIARQCRQQNITFGFTQPEYCGGMTKSTVCGSPPDSRK